MSTTTPLPDPVIALLRDAAKASKKAGAPLRRKWLEDPATLTALLPALLEAQARAALEEEGDPLGAHDLAAQGIELAEAAGFPALDLRLIQATALARSGSPLKARRLLESCVEHNQVTELIFGALARTYRDIAWEQPDAETKRESFREAADWSERGVLPSVDDNQTAQLMDQAYLHGQIAQFACLGGELERSDRAITRVLELCEAAQHTASKGQEFWLETNRAEMALLRNDTKKAAKHYQAMVKCSPKLLSSITANAKVCRKLLPEFGHPSDLLDGCFPLPPVVVFSGHMFDAPGRAIPRFPVENASAVKQAITDWLKTKTIQHGHVSASAGADLLFAEALIECGGSLRLVLPFSIPATRKHCVEAHGEEWVRRFDHVVAKAEDIVILEPGEADELAGNSAHYRYTNHQLLGAARLRASRMGLALRTLVVWDGTDAANPAPGGTGDFVSIAHSLDATPAVIPPRDDLPDAPAEMPAPQPICDSLDTNRRIRTFLFADVKGFSAIPEHHLRDFATRFLQTAADILHDDDAGVILSNTWGDALYAVFDSVENAAYTALRLRDEARLESAGGELRLRISLHAGPVYVSHDPVIRNEAYIGSNVVRTARMEPIAETGQVLVSGELAALLATSPQHHRYAFHYLGLARLPKGYGRMPAYELDHALR